MLKKNLLNILIILLAVLLILIVNIMYTKKVEALENDMHPAAPKAEQVSKMKIIP